MGWELDLWEASYAVLGDSPTERKPTRRHYRPMNLNPAFEDLFAGVDDLIHRIAEAENPEIRRLRARVYGDMMAAKRAVAGVSSAVATDARSVAAGDGELPTFYFALLLGVGVGLVTSLPQ